MLEKTSISLKEGTKSISSHAFEWCDNLLGITIPNSVTEIGSYAFDGCIRLTVVTIPNSVINIGDSAFSNCTSLTSITISNNVTSIGSETFAGCAKLTSIIIPDGVKSIGFYTFYHCYSLKMIVIPYSVTNIDNNAFEMYNSPIFYGYSDSYAQNYAKENSISFVALDGKYKYTDANTNVSIDVTNDAELSVKRLVDDKSIGDANTAIGGSGTVCSLFDISLIKNGNAVQPNGPATVKIPTDNENAKIYRIEDDGTATDMNAVYDNGYMVFTTVHFSLYALVVPNDNVFGDVNGDGVVNAKDRMLLTRYLAKRSGYENIDMTAADVNNDGQVNAKDRMILTRHLAKWQGYETLPLR